MALLKMYDGVTAENVPGGAQVYLGYGNGNWPSYEKLKALHPTAMHLSISVQAKDIHGAWINQFDGVDVENGDATPLDAVGWIVHRRAAGAHWAFVYCSESDFPVCAAAFKAANVPLPPFIVAGYPGTAPYEGALVPPGAVGHQFADHGEYDESVITSAYMATVGAHVSPEAPVSHPGSTHPPVKSHPTDIQRVLGKGYTGPDLALLRNALGTKGFHVLPSGIYDQAMFNAVYNFQSKACISRDGKCGPQTWHALGF